MNSMKVGKSKLKLSRYSCDITILRNQKVGERVERHCTVYAYIQWEKEKGEKEWRENFKKQHEA